MSYVDLHLHLLPGVDDGPADPAASLEYAARLAAAGVREATLTPHVAHARFPLDVATIPERTAELQHAVRQAGLRLALHPGGEIHPSGATDLTHRDLQRIAHGPHGGRWVLLEVPFGGVSRLFADACEHIRDEGFGVVIAHPERASGVLESGLERLREQLAAGAVLQVSVCSLLGHHGDEALQAARHLVLTGLAYVVASDGHGGARAHTLADGIAPIRAAGASATQAWQLTRANPLFLLRHGIVGEPVYRPMRRTRKRAVSRS
jgi:protein-tyrosine phosphatase